MRALPDLLECVGRGDRRDCPHTRACPCDHGVDRPAAHERPRRIVNENDRGVLRQRREPGADRVHALRAARDEAEPLAAQLDEPVGRPLDVPGRQRNDDLAHLRMPDEGPQRAEQHRDAEDGAELFRLSGARAHARPRCHHDYADVRLRADG